MTRDEHRDYALKLLGMAHEITPPAHPLRIAHLAEAQLHATLALSAPVEPSRVVVHAVDPEAAAVADATAKATTPRKRTAKKATPSKETAK